MEKRVVSLETQIALLQQEINALRSMKVEIPAWIKATALSSLGGIFLQTVVVVWWASSLTTTTEHLKTEISLNTDFRMEFPKLHEEVMVELGTIKVENSHIKEVLDEVKRSLDKPDNIIRNRD